MTATVRLRQPSASTWELYTQTFADDLRSEDLPPAKVYLYVGAGDQLRSFATELNGPDEVGPEHVRALMTHLLANRTSSTANNRVRASIASSAGLSIGLAGP